MDNYDDRMSTVLGGMIVALVIVLVLGHHYARAQECANKGGALVSTVYGYACVVAAK